MSNLISTIASIVIATYVVRKIDSVIADPTTVL